MANIPGITGIIHPQNWGGGPIKFDFDLDELEGYNVGQHPSFYYDSVVRINGSGWYSIISFDNNTYGSNAMRKLLKLLPHWTTELLRVVLKCQLTEVWNEQSDKAKSIVMAEILGSKYE